MAHARIPRITRRLGSVCQDTGRPRSDCALHGACRTMAQRYSAPASVVGGASHQFARIRGRLSALPGNIIGSEHLSLDHREINLHLVEPTGMNGQMDQAEAGIGALKSPDRRGSAMGRAIVHNPKYSLGAPVGLFLHHLLDEPVKGGDAGGMFTSAEDFGSSHIPSGQIRQRTAALIFEFHPHRLLWPGRQALV